ncbi:trypsin-like peptidase domain-containing protein [Oligoflexus tunisiensis]|uniref:trypsin-like peptidase domain-containing protein n=1 Tax=Oligoflexus tunisiensis TaxID=708132 RepID=UPI000AEAC379|nr:trypsin-like peptidase domain-containing protein [Oligoflexus tunisiensis]
MKRFLLSVPFAWYSLSAEAITFPEFGKPLPDAPEFAAEAFAAAYDFEGIVALSNCSGSLVRFEDSLDSDQAMVLSNGHCVSMIQPGKVINNQSASRSFDVLSSTGSRLGRVTATKLLYATMTKTDMSLYLLKETYQEILNKYETQALTLASGEPSVGTDIEVISGYWKRGYSCQVEAIVDTLKEGNWTFSRSVRYSRPGCEVIGGTSGSPVIEKGSRMVLAVNNTINESGRECTVNNPCEVDKDGNITYQKGVGYAQQTHWIYSCRDADRNVDLTVPGCQLPR